MFLTEQFIEKLFYFLEPELGTQGEHGNLRNSHKLVPRRTKVWEHQGVRLGPLVNLRDRSITTRLATAVHGRHGRGRRGRNLLHIAPVRVSRRRLNHQIGRVRLGRGENRHKPSSKEGRTGTVGVFELKMKLGLLLGTSGRRRRVTTARAGRVSAV